MKLTNEDRIAIILIIICAFLMTLEFGGNYDTFYEWLSGEANGFGRIDMPDDSLFFVLAWVYLFSLLGTLIFKLTRKRDIAKLCAYISSGSMGVFVIFGLYGVITVNSGELCIGMPLMLAATLALLYLSVTAEK